MSEVLFARDGWLGLITLNRPNALNALNHDMVRAILLQLEQWETDPAIQHIALVGSGERSFCAGGDIVSIHRDIVTGGSRSLDFWRDEYALNARIARYSKPIIAIMDGIVLGAGVGLACHASLRVVTETSSIGLPETRIGFVPDVGSTWLLSRAPGELGTHLALTAATTDAAGAILLGLADVFVERSRLAELRELLAVENATEALGRVQSSLTDSPLAQDQGWINECYSGHSVTDIVSALRSHGRHGVAESIELLSPTAVVLTLMSLRRARTLPSLEAALDQEFRVSARCLRMPDFAEGIRAQLIDKDRSPQWCPASLNEVEPALLEKYFKPVDG